MSIIRTPLGIKKLMRREGDNIKIITRTETVDSDGRVVYTHPNTISTKALIYAASGLRDTWLEIGYGSDIDYVVCISPIIGEFQFEEFFGDEFYTGTTVSVGDFILLSNNYKLEVREIVPRGLGFKKEYWEVLCRKVE